MFGLGFFFFWFLVFWGCFYECLSGQTKACQTDKTPPCSCDCTSWMQSLFSAFLTLKLYFTRHDPLFPPCSSFPLLSFSVCPIWQGLSQLKVTQREGGSAHLVSLQHRAILTARTSGPAAFYNPITTDLGSIQTDCLPAKGSISHYQICEPAIPLDLGCNRKDFGLKMSLDYASPKCTGWRHSTESHAGQQF